MRPLRPHDLIAIQRLFEADPAFWEQSEGAPPRATEAAAMMTDLPPGLDASAKHVFVVEEAGAPIAVIDVLAGYPDPATWYLGLLYVAPAARGRGLGTQILRDLADHIVAAGGARLRLAVVVENSAARRLYDRLGFTPVALARRPRITWTGATIFVDVLERPVPITPAG